MLSLSKILKNEVLDNKYINFLETNMDQRVSMSTITINNKWQVRGFQGSDFQPPDNDKNMSLQSYCTEYYVLEFKKTCWNKKDYYVIKCFYQDRIDNGQCGIFFENLFQFFNHLRAHTKEKPFVCPVEGCNARYTQVGNLNIHFAKKH